MIRAAELAVFLAPVLAVVLWRVAVARGLGGPPPRQLAAVFVALLVLAAALVVFAARDRLPPGRYVPAHIEDGRVVPGHAG